MNQVIKELWRQPQTTFDTMSLSVIKLLFSVMCFTCVVVASDIHISSPSQHHNNSSSSSPSSHARSLLHQMTGNHYQILPSFDRTLSPRQIKTKNGLLRGILISHPAVVVPSLVSASGKSGAHSSSNNITAVPSLSSSIRSPVISHPQSTTGSSELQAVEGFLGVPYASPPLGSLRFMPPVTPSHWRGVRMANSLGPSCPQKIPKVINNLSHGRMEYLKRIKPFMENQSEDCLYLNVYTPFDRGESNCSDRVLLWPVSFSLNVTKRNTTVLFSSYTLSPACAPQPHCMRQISVVH